MGIIYYLIEWFLRNVAVPLQGPKGAVFDYQIHLIKTRRHVERYACRPGRVTVFGRTLLDKLSVSPLCQYVCLSLTEDAHKGAQLRIARVSVTYVFEHTARYRVFVFQYTAEKGPSGKAIRLMADMAPSAGSEEYVVYNFT